MAAKNKSAVKRHKQSEVRRVRNKTAKSAIRTVAKKVVTAVHGKDAALAKESMTDLIKKIDTAARKGIVKKNAAARKKSRLQKLINQMAV